jgi:hypothetical protein
MIKQLYIDINIKYLELDFNDTLTFWADFGKILKY